MINALPQIYMMNSMVVVTLITMVIMAFIAHTISKNSNARLLTLPIWAHSTTNLDYNNRPCHPALMADSLSLFSLSKLENSLPLNKGRISRMVEDRERETFLYSQRGEQLPVPRSF